MYATITRSPSGFNNVVPDDIFNSLPTLFNQKKLIARADDFDRFRTADWTTTVVGTGSAAIIAGVGGILRLATSAGATDAVYMDKIGECFQAVQGQQVWFRGRFQVSDATNTELVGGLQTTDITPMAVTDGIYFHKPSAGTRMYLVQISAATGLTTTTDIGVDVANSTYADMGFWYDGVDTVHWQANDASGNPVARGAVAANLPAVTLTESFGILNAAAAIHDLDIDYVYAAQTLTR